MLSVEMIRGQVNDWVKVLPNTSRISATKIRYRLLYNPSRGEASRYFHVDWIDRQLHRETFAPRRPRLAQKSEHRERVHWQCARNETEPSGLFKRSEIVFLKCKSVD